MTQRTNTKKRGSNRGGRRGNNDQQSGLQRQNTGPRDGTLTSQQGRRGGVGRGQNQNKQAEVAPNGPAPANRNDVKGPEPAVAVPQEEHVPVNNFNAQEVRASLKMTSEVKTTIYKPAEKATPAARSGSPWASKRKKYCSPTSDTSLTGNSERDRKWQRLLPRAPKANHSTSAKWRDNARRVTLCIRASQKISM